MELHFDAVIRDPNPAGKWDRLILADDEGEFEQIAAYVSADLPPLVKVMLAASPDLYAMLKRLEWADDVFGCPECGRYRPDGTIAAGNSHAPDCELAALLRRVDGDA